MIYDLPTTVRLGTKEYKINSDYRAILEICMALTDPDLNGQEKAIVLLDIFYIDSERIPLEHINDAIKECFKFINLGESADTSRKAPKLMDWAQDFQHIVAPINRVLGKEVRELKYLHWWSFISAYYEIGDCTFAQIVRIREMKAKGKKLDKFDAEWYRNHKAMVDIRVSYSEAEESTLAAWGIK